MGKRLFIGGLPYQYSDSQLSELFSKAGSVVSATVVIDRMTSRGKGFGFVEFATDEEAENAIKMFNETDVEGRKIVVNVARPREERPQGNSGRVYQNDRNRSFDRRSGGNSNRQRW